MNSKCCLKNNERHKLSRIKYKYFSRLFVLCALFVVVLCACAAKSGDHGKPQTGLELTTISIAGESGTVSVEVEIAQTDKQRSTGLMYRTSLEAGKGMLFVFETDQVLSFWMKNTIIPLSIAYIGYDGIIIDIRDMYPNNTSSVHSSRSARYALEVPQGWFSKAGIKAGDKVTL